MGTDIHPAVEVRRNGVWRYRRPTERCRWYFETWDEAGAKRANENMARYDAERAAKGLPAKPRAPIMAGERRSSWDRCKTRLPDFFHDRNYAKFAVLGDVRNGYGFAGLETFEPLPAISVDRGRPADISPEAKAKLSDEHSPGWVTLQELLDYDFTIPLNQAGVISERQFLEALVLRKDPQTWSGDISGRDIEVVTPEEYVELWPERGTFGDITVDKRDPTKTYYIRYRWMYPLATAVPDVLEMIEYLKPLVPKGGTPDDVRVVFDFDS